MEKKLIFRKYIKINKFNLKIIVFLNLIDNCLAKNKKKTINILNENNFSNEDCILIVRTFLNKLKKYLNYLKNMKKIKILDLTISSAKPPIFWKDKEITKQQIFKWKPENIKKFNL